MGKRQNGYHTLTCPVPIDRKGNSSPARLILSGAPRCLLKNRSYHKAAAMSNRGCNQHLFSLFTTRLGSALPPSPPIAHRLPHYFPPPPPPPTPHHSHPSVSPAHSSVGVGLSHPLHACVYCRHGWIGFSVGGGGAEIELSPSSTPTTHLLWRISCLPPPLPPSPLPHPPASSLSSWVGWVGLGSVWEVGGGRD